MKNKISIGQAAEHQNLLTDGGLFIIHFPKEEVQTWPDVIGALTCTDQRFYGRSTLRFYTKDPGERDV